MEFVVSSSGLAVLAGVTLVIMRSHPAVEEARDKFHDHVNSARGRMWPSKPPPPPTAPARRNSTPPPRHSNNARPPARAPTPQAAATNNRSRPEPTAPPMPAGVSTPSPSAPPAARRTRFELTHSDRAHPGTVDALVMEMNPNGRTARVISGVPPAGRQRRSRSRSAHAEASGASGLARAGAATHAAPRTARVASAPETRRARNEASARLHGRGSSRVPFSNVRRQLHALREVNANLREARQNVQRLGQASRRPGLARRATHATEHFRRRVGRYVRDAVHPPGSD